MGSVKYLGYYDTAENAQENRGYTLSATNKMTYICSAMNEIGYNVEILSTSTTGNKKRYPGKEVPLFEGTKLRLFPSLRSGNKLRRIAKVFLNQCHAFFFLLRNTKRGEPVLVYHSLGYAEMVVLARKLKGFRLILEVEEIYADVSGSDWDRKREHRVFRAADSYIFSTEMLNEQINIHRKPYVVIHGTYQVERDRDVRFSDDEKEITHCVYAGTLDPRKGGGMAAAAAAYLPDSYHMHILGFGSEADKQCLQECIAQIQRAGGNVTYDGQLSGEEYIRFLQSCDIGLSTQNPDAAFNATSFPSKILSYMANGLQVVSIRIPAIENSAIGPYLHYYEHQTPEEIAKAILAADVNDRSVPREIIANLNREFIKKLRDLIQNDKR